jgi:FlaA1/EpsC-like NDP-sugar epimerase
MAVRFGNVLGSRGSILPLFQKQIEKGGPLTVTHGEMRRWFMTIPEACSLVLKAGGVGENGALYLLDMGEPIRIRDMAEQMIRFYGYEPEIDIKIETIGLRRGEKLFETLLSADEIPVPTPEHKILKIEKNRQPNLPFDSSSLDVPALLERLRPVCHFDPDHAESYRNTTLLRSILAEVIPTMER